MKQNHRGEYPDDWKAIAQAVKDAAGWKCVRCGHIHEKGHILTVHHLDCDKSNCEWWNIPALCQVCHLHIQGKVVMAQTWAFEHTPWFQPYAAGYYAHRAGLPHDREYVMDNLESLLVLALEPADSLVTASHAPAAGPGI